MQNLYGFREFKISYPKNICTKINKKQNLYGFRKFKITYPKNICTKINIYT